MQRAVDAFDWPLMKFIALRPIIRFAYFPGRRRLRFGSFANCQQRIVHGLRAFDMAAAVGWDRVESALGDYNVLPEIFFAGTTEHFQRLRETVLATT